jgi:hypothetical protein
VTRSASAVETRDDGTVVWPIELHPLTMGILVVALGAMAWHDPLRERPRHRRPRL